MSEAKANPSTQPSNSLSALVIFALGVAIYLVWPSFVDEPATAQPVLSESACREVFDGMVKGHHWHRMGDDEKRCSGFINKWARALPETTYRTTGSALLVNDAAYSLSGARATREWVKYADTKLETVVVRLPEGGVTLRFQSAEQADAALLAIGNAMGQVRAGN
jgi:hypothetical protein